MNINVTVPNVPKSKYVDLEIIYCRNVEGRDGHTVYDAKNPFIRTIRELEIIDVGLMINRLIYFAKVFEVTITSIKLI